MTVGIDWLEFTARPTTWEAMAQQLSGVVAGDFIPTDTGALGYRQMAVGSGQARIFWDSPSRPDEVHVQLKGEWCSAVSPLMMRVLATWIAADCKASRVDLAADDLGRCVLPSEVDGWIRAGSKVSRARAGRYYLDYATQGETVQIGSRASLEMLRVYDKEKESRGRINSVRWELQTRAEAARSLVGQLATMRWADVWRGRLVRFVDFREQRDGVPVTRWRRLPAFEEIVGSAVKLRAYDSNLAVPVLVKKLHYLEKYMGPLLAAVVAGTGGDVSIVYKMMDEGRKRWRWQHRYLAGQGSDGRRAIHDA